MNKPLVYGAIGAVAAYLIYKKFVATPEAKSTEAEEQPTEEGASEEGATGGGGGGGGSASPSASPSAPSAESTTAPEGATAKSTRVGSTSAMPTASIKPNQGMGIRPASKPRIIFKGAPISSVPKPTSKPPIYPKGVITRPIATKPMPRLAGFMDFDGNPDVLGDIM